MNSLPLFLAAVTLLTSSASLAQDAQLEFELRTRTTTEFLKKAEGQSEKKAPQRSESRSWVRLRAATIADCDLKSKIGTRVDWKREEIVHFDHANRLTKSSSFLAWIAGLEQEKDHRLQLAGTLEVAGVKDPSFELFWLESMFRSGRKAADNIKATEKDGTHTFARGAETVLTFTPGKMALPDDLRAAWKVFLIRTLPVHTAIRAKLASLPTLPSEIRYRYYNVGRRFDVVLTFMAWSPAGKNDAVTTKLEAARKAYGAWVDPKDPLDVFLADVAAKRIKVKTWTKKDYADQVKAKVKAGAHLDAFLFLLEGTFAYADLPVAELAAGIDTQSKEVLVFLRGMQLIGTDPAEGDKLLRGIKRDGLEGTATIDSVRAGALMATRKPQEAEALLLGVLRRRPWLGAPAKDLGDTYYARFNMAAAWRAWDYALSVSPKHPILQPVVRLRSDLRERYAAWLKP